MSKKLLFSDIDGTLIKNDGTIDDALADKLKQLSENGHGLILSSGRPLDSILPVQDYIEKKSNTHFADAYIISNNGAMVYDCNAKKTLLTQRVSLPMVNTIQQVAKDFGIHIQTYKQGAIVCEKEDDEIHHYQSRIKLPVVYTERFVDVLDEPPYKMLSIGLEGKSQQLPFKEYIETHFSNELVTFFSREEYMEIVNKDASKGNALVFLCKHLNVPIENAYAAGDLENDISMIVAAGEGYAMANGDDKVKASAKHITLNDCEHAGLIEVIDHMLNS